MLYTISVSYIDNSANVFQLEDQTLSAKFQRLSWRRATSFTWTRIPDPLVRRQLHMLATDGRSSLPEDKFNEVLAIDKQCRTSSGLMQFYSLSM